MEGVYSYVCRCVCGSPDRSKSSDNLTRFLVPDILYS